MNRLKSLWQPPTKKNNKKLTISGQHCKMCCFITNQCLFIFKGNFTGINLVYIWTHGSVENFDTTFYDFSNPGIFVGIYHQTIFQYKEDIYPSPMIHILPELVDTENRIKHATDSTCETESIHNLPFHGLILIHIHRDIQLRVKQKFQYIKQYFDLYHNNKIKSIAMQDFSA